jgi:rubrerythrin
MERATQTHAISPSPNRHKSEGYGEVASLFRAAARAEKIHATNYAAVIEELGALPQAQIEALPAA